MYSHKIARGSDAFGRLAQFLHFFEQLNKVLLLFGSLLLSALQSGDDFRKNGVLLFVSLFVLFGNFAFFFFKIFVVVLFGLD